MTDTTHAALEALERVPRDAADYIDDLIYLWPDGTWCREEDLEEYLGFMSDDFEVHQVLAYDEHDNPCHTERLSSTPPCSKRGRNHDNQD